MLQKCPTISVNSRSLLPFINEFVLQGFISQISIMLFRKNTSIKTYLHRSNKMLLLYPCDWKVTWLKTLVEKFLQNGGLLFFFFFLFFFWTCLLLYRENNVNPLNFTQYLQWIIARHNPSVVLDDFNEDFFKDVASKFLSSIKFCSNCIRTNSHQRKPSWPHLS